MKRILPILSFILLITFNCHAQVQTQAHSFTAADPGSTIIRFYPNPATTNINFNFQKNYEKGYSLQIFNLLGKKMYEASNINPQSSIDLTGFNRGLYIYQLFDRTGKIVESGKFQVSR